MATIPIAPIERLMRNSGAERVSADGARALRNILEEIAVEMAKHAVEMAKHAGRKTVRAVDVEMARFKK